MIQRIRRTRRSFLSLVCAGPAAILTGCGGPRHAEAIPADQQGLRELAAAYRDFFHKNRRAPKGARELRGKGPGQGLPNALDLLNSGELVVAWGSPPADDGGDTILAFSKAAPERGGPVLMQDCRTIRPLTAEEFAATPRAAAK
ncbi:hypothetical protein OJF2_09920 [Aquisphaera giovannonii]|uniref:Uncharacterized protein n=1 Tax=Aquisphaera giovannonii TaxID=406548 RepID=A0A5B9VXL2_9BACT|nr:phosphodiester glycosidase family protein [Aquisphaera giovannonii]QEH32515.1 hypothetical protein OJF2_09920 [Aquisphaera giovannonii]